MGNKKEFIPWDQIAKKLPDSAGYNDLAVGKYRKLDYVNKWLPHLANGTEQKILDIGAGTGFFCSVCQELGHSTLAVLRPCKEGNSEGYNLSCNFLEVAVLPFDWASEEAPISDKTFDVVNAEGALGMNPVEKWEFFLDDMFRVIKIGGVMMLLVNRNGAIKNKAVIESWCKKMQGKAELEQTNGETGWKWKRLV